ncbi:SecDF P1 head subdomain-containing protein [Pseudoxanthomonas beigongshangi]
MRTFMRGAILALAGLMVGACSQPGSTAATEHDGVPPAAQVTVLMREVAPSEHMAGITTLPWKGGTIALFDPPFVQTRDIALINLVNDASGQPALTARFTDEAAPRIEQATKARVGRQVALTVDDRVITVANIAGWFGHSMQFSGEGRAETLDLYREITGQAPPVAH